METATPEAAPAEKNYKGHTHKSNFGRYVEGCARCEEIRLDPSLKTSNRHNKGRSKVQSYLRTEMKPEDIQNAVLGALPNLSPTGTFSYEQMQALLQAQAEKQAEAMMAFVKELKAPDPETVAQREAEKAKKAEALRRHLEEVRISIEAKENLQNSCSHTKENGKPAKHMGQLFSDGMFHPMCHHCGKEWPAVAPIGNIMTGGVDQSN